MGESNDKVTGGLALKAGAWYVVSTILVKAISIITTPIFTRLMTTEEYGVTSTFSSWYALLLTFCTLNLTYSIGRAKLDYPDKLDDYIGSMQILSALVTLVISIAVLVFIKPLAAFLELPIVGVILLLVYLLFSPAINFFQNGYRYRYKYKENVGIAWYTAISTVVLSLLLFFCFDIDKAILRMIGITVPCVALSIVFWVKSLKRGNLKINLEYWKYGFSLSGPLILHTVSMNILSQSDRIFIAKICGASDTGIYSLVYNYGILLSIVTTAVSDGWLPWFHDAFFAKKYDEIRKNSKLIVVFGCYVGLACIALAPEAIALLGGEKYASGIYCIPPIVLGIVSQYIYTHYVNIELHLKKTKFVSMGTIFAACLNLVLNAIFIPLFGYVAASYTTLVSYIALMLIHFIITRKVLKVKLYNDLFMFGALMVTALITVVISIFYSYNLVRHSLIVVGFLSFLYIFREYIGAYLRKFVR